MNIQVKRSESKLGLILTAIDDEVFALSDFDARSLADSLLLALGKKPPCEEGCQRKDCDDCEE